MNKTPYPCVWVLTVLLLLFEGGLSIAVAGESGHPLLVKEQAIWESSFGKSSQDKDTLEEDKIDLLIKALGTREWEEAVEELAALGKPAVPSLVKTLRARPQSRYAPYRAALALGKIGTQEAEQALLDALGDRSLEDYIQRGVMRGLAEIGSAPASEALAEVLKNPELSVSLRGPAADALARMGSPDVVVLFSRIIKDAEEGLGFYICGALAAMGTDQARSALLAALEFHPRYFMRSGVADALGGLPAEKILPFLHEAMKNDDWFVWKPACESLQELGEPALKGLIHSLHDEKFEVRWKAAWVLGNISSEQGVKPLIEALADQDDIVRNQAAVSLARIGSDDAAEPLRKLLKEEDASVGRYAAWVLEALEANPEEISPAEITPPLSASEEDHRLTDRVTKAAAAYRGRSYALYPYGFYDELDVPSPCVFEKGEEMVTALTKDGKYTLVPVSVANGKPYVYTHFGRGKQLEVDARDFPTLARTGLHGEAELERIMTITGRSTSEITMFGRPGRSSGAGFMAQDEDIVSVLKGDNRQVKALGLTHPDLARALFHIWNYVREQGKAWKGDVRPFGDLPGLLYNGNKILVAANPTKGWQDSIFNDEIYGGYHIDIQRALEERERSFLAERYAHLKPEELQDMMETLTHIHIGEMQPYYIMRYGFYEGHTDYRADPIAISWIFGLRSLEEIEEAFPGGLYQALTDHFTRNSFSGR